MSVKAYDDISLSYLSVTCKPDEVYLLNTATLPKFRAAQNSMFRPWCLASFQQSAWQETTCGGQVILSWPHQMVSSGIIPKAGSIVCSGTVGRWSINSQPEATELLQKIKNTTDVVAYNSRTQDTYFLEKKKRGIYFINCYLKSEVLLSNKPRILPWLFCDIH